MGVNVINAPAAANAALGALNLAGVAQLRAIVDATVNAPPSLKREVWIAATGAVGVVGKGSQSDPFIGLENAVAGLGALAADADETGAAAVPYVLTLYPGEYAAPSKPFKVPVVLRLLEGARFATTSGAIPAELPTRTATGTFPALFAVVAEGAGPVIARPFSLVVGAGAYAPVLVYQGNGNTEGAGGMTLGNVPAATGATAAPTFMRGVIAGTFGSSGNAWTDNCTITGAVAAAAVLTAAATAFGAAVAAVAVVARMSTLAGNVTSAAITLDDYSARTYQVGTITCSTPPSVLGAMAQGRVQGDTTAAAASPQTINFSVPFPVAPDSVVVTPNGAADATTFWRVSGITTTGFVVTYGGTAPTAWNWMAIKSA